MKRLLPFAVLGLAAIAATCTITNESLTAFGGHDTFGAELQNDSGVNILTHSFTVSFLDEDNDVVETKTVEGCLRSLQDGRSNFFSASSSLPADTTKGALARLANLSEDSDTRIGRVEDSDITITNIAPLRTGGSLTVTGAVTNNDSDSLEDPTACAVVYKTDGRILAVAKDVTLLDLSTGQSDTFSITMAVPDSAGVLEHVDIWVDGVHGSDPVEPESSTGTDIIDATPTATGTPATATPTSTPTPTQTPSPEPTV
jgi:hypothetical protein